ncbi:MAG: helix-turn-helix transcriptional regulator [Pseudomonadota bacterium]|nr:helix-turn-helix transcriptional regulator [Pseudomonadota bacterium]
MTVIYNRIKLLRIAKGLSRQALANLVCVNVQTIGYLERQAYNPSLWLAFKLAGALGVPIDKLFSMDPFKDLSDSL